MPKTDTAISDPRQVTPGNIVRSDLGAAPEKFADGAQFGDPDREVSEEARAKQEMSRAGYRNQVRDGQGAPDDAEGDAGDLGYIPEFDEKGEIVDAYGDPRDDVDPDASRFHGDEPRGRRNAADNAPAEDADGQAMRQRIPAHLRQAAQLYGFTEDQILAEERQHGTDALVEALTGYHAEVLRDNQAALARAEAGQFGQSQASRSPDAYPAAGQYGQPSPGQQPATPAAPGPASGVQAPGTGQTGAPTPFRFSEERRQRLRDGLGTAEAEALEQELGAAISPYVQTLQQIQSQLEQESSARDQANTAALANQVHGWLDTLEAPGGGAYYGKSRQTAGPMEKLRRDSTIRMGVAIYNANGGQVDLHQAMVRAHQTATSELAEQRGREQVQRQIVHRHRGTSIVPSRPGGGHRRPKSPEQDAAMSIANVFQKHGVPMERSR